MDKLSFRLRMAAHYTGFMTVVGLIALLAKAPAPALWAIAALWLWFAKAFWQYRADYLPARRWSDQWAARPGGATAEQVQERLRRIWRWVDRPDRVLERSALAPKSLPRQCVVVGVL